MIFNDLKSSLPTIKLSGKQKSKKDEGSIEIDPNQLLAENGLIGEKLIQQGHSSCVISGFYHQTMPAFFEIIYRENESAEENQLMILKSLNGQKHIIELYDNILKHKYAIFIFKRVEAIPASKMITKSLTLDNLRLLLRGVLEALEEAHRIDIVHRDIRLENIMVKPNFEEVYLTGWDCATKISENMNSSIGSMSARSPEMLMGYNNYKKKGDIWAFGVLIIYILSDGRIPWKSETSKETLIEMAAYFGAQNILDLENTLHLHCGVKSLKKHVDDMIVPLQSSFAPSHADLDNEDLMDLIHKCFALDYRLRPNVSDLLDHAFFKS